MFYLRWRCRGGRWGQVNLSLDFSGETQNTEASFLTEDLVWPWRYEVGSSFGNRPHACATQFLAYKNDLDEAHELHIKMKSKFLLIRDPASEFLTDSNNLEEPCNTYWVRRYLVSRIILGAGVAFLETRSYTSSSERGNYIQAIPWMNLILVPTFHTPPICPLHNTNVYEYVYCAYY